MAIQTSIFDTPATPRLLTLLEWVRQGQLFIPDFQRPFVWDDERRLNLLDSVSRGLPIGAFLTWRTMLDELRTHARLGPFELPKPSGGDAQTLLIDGHQRLTTLYAALVPLEPGDEERLAQEQVRWPVYFDLEASDEDLAFVLAPRRRGFTLPSTWLPTNELFDRKALWRRQHALRDRGLEPLAERSDELSNAFKEYMIPVVPLVTDDVRAVTRSFVRVNSGGRAMAEDKLLRALIYFDYSIDEHIDEIRAHLGEIGWGEISSQTFVNALKIRLGLDVYRSTPFDIQKVIGERGEAQVAFRQAMDQLGRGMHAAAKIARSCGFPGPAILPYQYQLIGLCEALLRTSETSDRDLDALVDDDEVAAVVWQWLWSTTYLGSFTGMSGSQIRDAIDDLTNAIIGGPMNFDVSATIEPLPRYRAGATRSAAFALFMASYIQDEALRDRVWSRLGELGHGAVDCIFPRVPSSHPGNRVVTIPGQLERLRAFLSAPSGPPDEALLRDHFVPEGAVELYANDGDPELFCDWRALYLAKREANLVSDLDLTFEDS